jgi:hypothetical protein
MTDAQWLMEFEALQEMEKERVELFSEFFGIFKKMLIRLLGLDLPQYMWSEDESDKESFIPLSLMTARREIIEHFLKGMEEKEKIDQALEDDEFEKISKAMASGDIEDIADMEPVVSMKQIDEALKWNGPVRQKELKMLGIKIIDDLGEDENKEDTELKIKKKASVVFDKDD